MKHATLVRRLRNHFTGEARLYKVEPAASFHSGQTNYVVVSATDVTGSGPETYIFPANENGEITSWGEMDGSFRGSLDHHQALANAGYSIQQGESPA